MITIKKSIPETKTKILVKCSISEKNLIISVVQALHNGENVDTDKKEFVNKYFPELQDLLSLDRENINGGGSHFKSTAKYLFKKSIDSLAWDQKYYREDYTKELNNLKNALQDHKALIYAEKYGYPDTIDNLSEYIDIYNVRFKYSDIDKSQEYFNSVFERRLNNFYTIKNIKNELSDYFEKVKSLRKFISKYCFETLESKSEIWTHERLADYLKVDVKLLYPIYFSNTKEKDLDHVLEISAKNRSELVAKVVQKYKIK